MALDICKAFDRVWNADLLQKLVSYANSDQIFGFIFSLLSNRWLLMVLDGKSAHKYPVNGGIYADATVYSKCDQAYDLWQHLEFASEIESDLRDTADWARKWLVDFNTGKTQIVSFDRFINTGAYDVKMDESVLEEKSFFKMLGLTFFSKFDWGSYIISVAKTASKKIGVTICSMKFLSPEVALYFY